jgi:hypothetical protein
MKMYYEGFTVKILLYLLEETAIRDKSTNLSTEDSFGQLWLEANQSLEKG